MLDTAHRHGLRALHGIGPRDLDDTKWRQWVDERIAKARDHPATYAYYLQDEPTPEAFALLARLKAYIHERDPHHPIWVNLYPSYANNGQLGTEGDAVTAYAAGQDIDVVGSTVRVRASSRKIHVGHVSDQALRRPARRDRRTAAAMPAARTRHRAARCLMVRGINDGTVAYFTHRVSVAHRDPAPAQTGVVPDPAHARSACKDFAQA